MEPGRGTITGHDVLRLDVPLSEGRLILGVTVTVAVLLGLLLYYERMRLPSGLPPGPVAAISSGFAFCSTFFPAFVAIVADEAAEEGFMAARWLPGMSAFSLGMLALHPRLRRLALVRGYVSPADFVQDRFPEVPRLTGMVRLCLCLATVLLASLQLEVCAQMLAAYAELPGAKLLFSTLLTLVALVILAFETKRSTIKEAVGAAIVIVTMLELSYIVANHYTWLGAMAQEDCSTGLLVKPVNRSQAKEWDFAAECKGDGCVAVGCVSVAHPEFYKDPEHSEVFGWMIFVMSWLGFALMPDMMMRQGEPMADRIPAAGVLLPAAVGYVVFITGIKAGIVKATLSAGWPLAQQQGTAIATISVDMVRVGVPLLKHIVLDILGAGFVIAVLNSMAVAVPNASRELALALCPGREHVLQVPVALLMLAFSSFPGFIRLSDGVYLLLGILLQALPSFALGLFSAVRPEPLLIGIIVGSVSELVLYFVLAKYSGVLALVANCAAVALLRARARQLLQESVHSAPLRGGPGLNKREIDSIMLDTREPSQLLIGAAFVVTVVGTAVFLRGKQGYTDLGLPHGVQNSLICSLAGFALTVLAAFTWSPYPVERRDRIGVELASVQTASRAASGGAVLDFRVEPLSEVEAPVEVLPQVRPFSDDDLPSERSEMSSSKQGSHCVFYNIAEDPPDDADAAAGGASPDIPDPFAPDELARPRRPTRSLGGTSPSASSAAPSSPSSARFGSLSGGGLPHPPTVLAGAAASPGRASTAQSEAAARLVVLYAQADGEPSKIAALTGCNAGVLKKNRPASPEDFAHRFLEGHYGGAVPPGPGDSFAENSAFS